jgi:hypothetical protein
MDQLPPPVFLASPLVTVHRKEQCGARGECGNGATDWPDFLTPTFTLDSYSIPPSSTLYLENINIIL